MLRELSVVDYVDALGSGAETPGGGSASALAGALGTAAALMVNYFTVDNEKFSAGRDEILQLIENLQDKKEKLLQGIDDDAAAFAGFGKVYAMPKNTPEEKAARAAAMQATLQAAMRVPLEIMETAVAALEKLPRLCEIGNPNLITDTGVAATLLEAAVRAARVNVLINLKFIKDLSIKKNAAGRVRELTARAAEYARTVAENVEKAL